MIKQPIFLKPSLLSSLDFYFFNWYLKYSDADFHASHSLFTVIITFIRRPAKPNFSISQFFKSNYYLFSCLFSGLLTYLFCSFISFKCQIITPYCFDHFNFSFSSIKTLKNAWRTGFPSYSSGTTFSPRNYHDTVTKNPLKAIRFRSHGHKHI